MHQRRGLAPNQGNLMAKIAPPREMGGKRPCSMGALVFVIDAGVWRAAMDRSGDGDQGCGDPPAFEKKHVVGARGGARAHGVRRKSRLFEGEA